MSKVRVNDMVVRFSNVNGTGSASANDLFSKSVFRMGIPLSSKNIFPSNIQGLPTWYEVRISDKGYLGRREGIDVLVAVNPQSFKKDVDSVKKGGYLIYDSTKKLHDEFLRDDINFIGVPMMQLCMEHYEVPRQQQLFKNIVYVGALAALLDVDLNVVKNLVAQMFARKEKLIPPNHRALDLGYNYAREHYDCPLNVRLETRDMNRDKIMIDGNTAAAIGAIYGGATVAGWYPITPSTSMVSAFEKYCNKLRIDADTGKKKFAIVQAEDELAAMGMVIGAAWNGARAFTATSGAGVSLMSEFIGLAYYAEVPVVLLNIQRGGPSTGMPTRTQQSDLLMCAYASHGDTKHVLLFPSTPKECFDMTADAFDLAEKIQAPVIVMSDLDLGMNNHVTDEFTWDENRKFDRGKVLSAKELRELKEWGRYLDVDGDGICYRTIPGTDPELGSYFTRGSSHDEFAKYTEDNETYVRLVDRIKKKYKTAISFLPKSELIRADMVSDLGIIFLGTTIYAAEEASDILESEGMPIDTLRIKAFPFGDGVVEFISSHQEIFVVEQNRDAQLRTLLINELEIDPAKLKSVLNYDGQPISADTIVRQIKAQIPVPEAVQANNN